MRRTHGLAVAAAVAITLTACGGGDDPADNGDAGDEPTGGTVRSTMGDAIETLLPMDSNSEDNIGILEVLHSGLVRYDPETTEPYNYIAEDVTSDDNITWTITIKDGWTFQNDEPVDAASFARAWNYAAYGPNAVGNNYFFERFVGYDDLQAEEEGAEPAATELSGLRVVDDLTLEVELNQAFGGFPTMLGYTGFFPVAQACIDDIEQCSIEPIGNGPFQIDGPWQPEIGVTATLWDGYAGDEAPSYDTIEWTAYTGDDTSWPDFLAGDVDVSRPPPAEWESAMNDADLNTRMAQREGAALTYLGFPLYDPTFDNIDLRRAFALAIDVETIIETIAPGRFLRADSWVVPDGVPGGEAGTCDYCRFDPDEAQTLLEQAGGWPEGQVLTIGFGADPESEALFKAIGDQLQQNLGIEYQLDPLEDFFSKRSEKGFAGNVFRNNWFPDYPLNENYLAPIYAGGPDVNNFGWESPEFDAKIAEGDQAATIEEAVAAYQEAEAILAEDLPTVPLTWGQSITFYSENLDNVTLDPFSGGVELRTLEVVS